MNSLWANIKAWFLYDGTGYSVQVGTLKHCAWIPKWEEVNAMSEAEAIQKVRAMGLVPAGRVVKLMCATFDPSFPIISLLFLFIMQGCSLYSIINGNIISDIPTSVILLIWGILTVISTSCIIVLLIDGYRNFKKHQTESHIV
jgi:hypothetical protein